MAAPCLAKSTFGNLDTVHIHDVFDTWTVGPHHLIIFTPPVVFFPVVIHVVIVLVIVVHVVVVVVFNPANLSSQVITIL